MLASLRQLLYPKEFRIAPSAWPTDLVSTLEEIIDLLHTTEAREPKSEIEASSLLADVGTGLWRISKKLHLAGMKGVPDEVRRALRHLESTLDTLTQRGIEIKDHTGESYNGGMALSGRSISTDT